MCKNRRGHAPLAPLPSGVPGGSDETLRKIQEKAHKPRDTSLLNRYLLRLFDCLEHPNLGAPFATDPKWPICYLHISYQSLAGGPQKLAKIRVFKVDYFILSIFLVPKLRSMAQNEWNKHPIFYLLLVQK